jgi:hypothetical protein
MGTIEMFDAVAWRAQRSAAAEDLLEVGLGDSRYRIKALDLAGQPAAHARRR